MRACRYQRPPCDEPLVGAFFCDKHLHEVSAELGRTEQFKCSWCKVWLRERPPIGDKLIEEAYRLNKMGDLKRLSASVVGNRPLIRDTLTLTITDTGDLAREDMRETLRFCPSCALVAKDALLELGFTLGFS